MGELFNALTQKEMLQIFTRNPVKMEGDAKKDTEFVLLDGVIHGTYTEVTPYTKITQTKEDTKLNLTQSSVPHKELENTRQGWLRYYFHAIKQSFGFGSSLF